MWVRRMSVISAALWCGTPAVGAAERRHGSELVEPSASPGWSGLSSLAPEELWNGGALPFGWGALLARAALDRWVDPPDRPRWFPASEGGATVAAWEVPDWTLTAAAGAVGGAMALGDDGSRWAHVKGLAETLATGRLLTGALKVTFGRHRPDYAGDPDAGFGGGDRSFPSGHATVAFELATYGALYLRAHGFERWRPSGHLPWWEGAAYGGIFAGAALVAAERVLHHRHHPTDVLAGAALGTATAALFFAYQERRVRRARPARPRLILAPASWGRAAAGVSLSWQTW